jgi:ATP-binding cassette subfamily B protein
MAKQMLSNSVRQVLRDYVLQYKDHPWYTFFSFFMPAVGTVLIFFVPPLIVAKLINMYVAQQSISSSVATKYIALFAGLWLLGEMLWRIGLHFLIKLDVEALRALSRSAFSKLAARDYDFYTNNFVGSLSKKASAYARNFEMFTDTLTFNVVNELFPMIFAIIVLWRYSPIIPLALVFSLMFVVAVAIPIIRRRAKLVTARHEAGSKMIGRLSDTLTNMLTIKSFATETSELRTYGRHVDDFTSKFKKAADFQNLRFDIVMSPMYVLTNVFGLMLTINLVRKLGLEPGAMLVIFTYFSQLTRIFWEINRIYRNLESSVTEAAEFVDLLATPPSVQDNSRAQTLQVSHGAIEFSEVSFDYRSEKDTATFLRNLNIYIPANQKVGLVGPSGGGKTTITRLLLRFMDVDHGSVLIDGQNISAVTQESLRKSVAYVPQEPLLFHRSLFENIAYGDESATEADVISVAKIAHAHEFISALPDGYQTLVGERGIKLSGGQRQRVAIARALLKKAKILVLDEATSALDSESEKYIQDGLLKLMKNKTALVIAHRLSTIKHLDRIIVLDQGRVVQDGTHQELIAKKGLYAKLWSHQSGEFL